MLETTGSLERQAEKVVISPLTLYLIWIMPAEGKTYVTTHT